MTFDLSLIPDLGDLLYFCGKLVLIVACVLFTAEWIFDRVRQVVRVDY